jgi:hypothetical protein
MRFPLLTAAITAHACGAVAEQTCPLSAANGAERDSVFREWLHANGVDLSGYEFNYEEGKGYGLVTKIARLEGEVCAQAPFRLAMSEQSAMSSRVGEMMAEAKQDPHFLSGRSQEDTVQVELLQLHLIFELIHINASFYGPYLGILPSINSSSSPLYSPRSVTAQATETDWVPGRLRKHLAGSSFFKEVAKQRGLMQLQFNRISHFFFEKYSEFAFDGQNEHMRRLTNAQGGATGFWELFMWGTNLAAFPGCCAATLSRFLSLLCRSLLVICMQPISSCARVVWVTVWA